MTVLVTGGAGYIGSHLVLALVDAGQDVVVLDNLSTGFSWMVHSKAHFVQGDCGDEALVADLIQNTASMPSPLLPDPSLCRIRPPTPWGTTLITQIGRASCRERV